jgi:hypothetical protein
MNYENMKLPLRLTLVIALLMLAVNVYGQEKPSTPAKPEAPSGPLIGSVPDFSQWEISFSYPKARKKKSAAVVAGQKTPTPVNLSKSITTKTKDIIHEEMIDISGNQTQKWYIGRLQYTKLPGQSNWFESDGSGGSGGKTIDPAYSPLPATGFRDLDWISADTYVGTVKYNKCDCLIFVPGGTATLDKADSKKDARLQSEKTIAYIDVETRLPVLVRFNGETRNVTFNAQPTTMLTLPVELTEQVKQGEEGRARLSQPAPLPY